MPERLHETWIHSNRFIPRRFVRPIETFMSNEASSGIVLLLAAVAALVWANAPFGETYERFWSTELVIEIGGFHLAETLEALVNDGLMAIFFFLVGLEIKRELVLGELRDPKAAALPVMGALGGMIFPALIFVALVAGQGGEALRGWGVPVATDIAFSLGVLAVLGKRVPTGAKIFLLALAIADDLGGILVIALFYTSGLSFVWLGLGLAGLALIYLASKVGIRSYVFYTPMAFAVWFFFLESGVHATIAGVALAFLTPARPMYSVPEYDAKARRILDMYVPKGETQVQRERSDFEAMMLADIARESVSPLTRLEHRLQPWVAFGIIPIFALANAGVRFEGSISDALLSRVALGVALGLLVGKTVGISLFTWLAVRLGWGRLPRETTWRHIVGVAAVAGIGFTVALFIAALAFTTPEFADEAKVGIFAGSILAGLLGAGIFLTAPRAPQEPLAKEPPREEEVPVGT